MNILFILNTVTPQRGGVSMVTYNISTKMKEEGHQVYYLYDHFEPFIQYEDKQFFVSANIRKTELTNILFDVCKSNNIDIIINQTGYSKAYTYALKNIKLLCKRIKIVTFFHASPDFWKKQLKQPPFYLFNIKTIIYNIIKRFYYNIYNKQKKRIERAYAISDQFILLSQFFINDFIKIYNVGNGSKLNYINNPCTLTSTYKDSRLKKKQVLVVGRLSEKQKRMSRIINIWKDIEPNHPDWKLIFVGNGPNKKDYEKLVSSYNLKNVQFEGQQVNTAKYYAESQIFLMTSIWEGWGLTLVEALYFNCIPILFDNFGACHDIIENEVNGILIPNNDKYLFSTKLSQLLEDPYYLEKLRNNRNELMEKFNINTIYATWKEKILN